MPGKVYAFNCYNEPIAGFSVNGKEVGEVGPWSEGGEKKPFKFTPSGIEVPRSKEKIAGSFGIGKNNVSVPWHSFTGAVTVDIPDPKGEKVSLDDPLALFVCTNQAFLLTERGYVLGSFKMQLESDGKEVTAYA